MPNLGNEKKDWDSVLKGSFKGKSRKLIDVRLPKVNELENTHRKRHKEELLFKIFDYNRLIDNPVASREGSDGDSSKELSDLSLNTSSDASLDNSGFSTDQQLQGEYDEAVRLYKEGVKRLKQGAEKEGESMIIKSARMGFPYAMYAYAIIKFGEIWRSYDTGHVRGAGSSEQEIIENAVNYMSNSKSYFFPLNNFVLGMIKLYDIGGYKELIKDESIKSWQGYFASVLLATEGTPLMDEIKESKILSYIQCDTFGFVKPDRYMGTIGDEKGMEDLKWMVRCIEYELVRELISNPKNVSVVGSILKKLSSDGFADARYLYAFALLKGVFGELEYNDAGKVYNLLRSSIDVGHQEAKLLFATLPFRKGFEFLKGNRIEDGRKCFNYLKDFVYDDNANKYFKEVSALLVAREYLNKDSCYVLYDEEKAKDILRDAGCIDVLKELDRKLERQQEGSKNVLRNVLKILKKVFSVSKESNDSKLGRLVSAVEELFQKLKISKISIQQSDSLSHILKLLDNASSIGKGSLLSLRQLCAALEEEFEKQSRCSLQEEILQLLRDLDKVCSTLQEERSGSLPSSIGTTSNSTVQLLHTEPVKDKSKSMSDVFVNSQLSAPQGCSTPLSSRCEGVENPNFFFDAASSSTGQPLHTETVEGGRGMSESRDRGSILKGLQEIKDKIEDYDVENEERNYHEGDKEYITNVMEKMGNLISAFRKESELKELLERQQEQMMPQEDVEPFKELISIFKDHVGSASLIRALKPLTEIEQDLKSNNPPYKVSEGFKKRLLNVIGDCEFLSLSANSKEGLQDHGKPDFRGDMSEVYDSEVFTTMDSRQLSHVRQGFNFFVPPFSPSSKVFDLPEGSMHGKVVRRVKEDLPSKDMLKRRMSLAVHDRSDDGKLLGGCFEVALEFCKKGEYRKALEIFEQVFDRRKSVLGYKDYNTVMVRYNMAVLFYKLGERKEALKIFYEMERELSEDSPYVGSVKHNIKMLSSGQEISSLMVPEEKQEEFLIQFCEENTEPCALMVSKNKGDYGPSFDTSGFAGDSTTFLDGQDISGIANSSHGSSSAFGRTDQKQNSGNSQQNASKTEEWSKDIKQEKPVLEAKSKKEWSGSVKPKKTVHSSKSKVGATGSIPNKHTLKEQERREKNKVNSCGRGRGK